MLVADDALSYSLLNIGNCIVFVGASSTETRSIECMSFVGSSVYVRYCFFPGCHFQCCHLVDEAGRMLVFS